MISRKRVNPTAESVARANRQRLARMEGARAMADVQQQAIAVRKNMERLRGLREAKEAQEPDALPLNAGIAKKTTKKIVLAK